MQVAGDLVGIEAEAFRDRFCQREAALAEYPAGQRIVLGTVVLGGVGLADQFGKARLVLTNGQAVAGQPAGAGGDRCRNEQRKQGEEEGHFGLHGERRVARWRHITYR